MHVESSDRPFAELPSRLVDDILKRTEGLSQRLMNDAAQIRRNRTGWREQLSQAQLLQRDSDLPYVPIPTTCGVDGSYAVERLLASDYAAAAAVAVEGLTPPSELRYWPEPYHSVEIEVEQHHADTGTVLRAIMTGMELSLAAAAPHDVVFVDGSLTTPLIYFNQALNKASDASGLKVTRLLLARVTDYLESYCSVLSSARTDRCWVAVPKYTTRREIGRELDWPSVHDDRGLLTRVLEPGEFTRPRALQQPESPWPLNTSNIPSGSRDASVQLASRIIGLLAEIRVVYYRPHPWLPALRLETSRAAAENPARLASILHGVRHQCGTPAVMEPYPLYLADRMVKHLPRALPTFRQVTSQRIAETYEGDITEVFLALHGYRTESGG